MYTYISRICFILGVTAAAVLPYAVHLSVTGHMPGIPTTRTYNTYLYTYLVYIIYARVLNARAGTSWFRREAKRYGFETVRDGF